jgi:tRNA(Ile)-lysidine synthase
MAMLYLLHRFDIDTIVVHCNYQLRGDASEADQKLVEDICMHWKMECISLRFESKENSDGNFQDWARNRRYQAFKDIKKEYDADVIITAHHQDDQLETILQKILRGAGVAAWSGMDVLEGELFRPLLNVSKSEIIEFVQQFNIPYRIDRTNEESTYARNFIRNHWFPDLNRLFPGWKKNLQKLTDRAEEFSLMSDLILQQVSNNDQELRRDKFLELHSKIKPVILLQFLKKNIRNAEISQGFLNNTDDIFGLQSGGGLQISESYFLVRDREFFKVRDVSEEISIHQKINKDEVVKSLKVNGLKLSVQLAPQTYSDDYLYLDEETLEYPLTLRNWQDGDSFQPLGMKGTQLVSDHLTNRKIPSTKKKQALVLESFDTTICAVIFPNYSNSTALGTISEQVRCTPSTNKTLTITKTNKYGSLPT